MNFKLDENVPWILEQLIKAQGSHHVDTVFHQHHVGISDTELLAICAKDERIIITLDSDFLNIQLSPGVKIPGILLLRPATQGKSAVKALMAQFLKKYRLDNIRGKIIVVEPSQVRIRLL